jgi:hypothetical protein
VDPATYVDEQAVKNNLAKKKKANARNMAPFRIPRTGDPLTRTGLFSAPTEIPFREIVKSNNEMLKSMRGVEVGVKRLNDTTKAAF